MGDSPVPEEERAWVRRLASREDREMLDAAHAAMHLWSQIETPRNFALAQLLLGQVHAYLHESRSKAERQRFA